MFFIATLFSEGRIMKEEIPIKCKDPGPCTVTYKPSEEWIFLIAYVIPEHAEMLCLSRIGELTILADFHVIMPTKGDKGGKPQVLLGRPFLKTAEFKLIYYDKIFTFSVGNVIEIFYLTPPPKPPKKGIHQLKVDNAKVQNESSGRKAKVRIRDGPKERINSEKGSRNPPPQSNGKKKKVPLNPEKKKKEPNEAGTKKKRTKSNLSV
ncbi:hypothetical protein PIB30_074581 [Stylosanthes scabra]|uniref:Nucleoplasmin-like domain-containing protein n=1 Tax=Stylosanthes scabra TaxID=79078 RepID=A0ABU6VN47_9FABA|nr:hypothetical protein [Stylosanthes scabra]